jgi:uncharacterized membrane protein
LGRPLNSGELTFEFGVPLGTAVAIAAIALAVAVAWVVWWPRLRTIPRARRAVVVALRVAVLALALFLLADPMLVGRRVDPGEDYVILLFDDSRSMRIAGEDGVSRSRRLLDAYAANRDAFEGRLRAEHQIAVYRFGETISRVEGIDALRFEERESNPLGAIEAAVKDLAGAHVSAVVLFSDGVSQGSAANEAAEAAVRAPVPVYSVGVDTEAPWRDLEVKSVSVAPTNFDNSPVSLAVHVAATGLAGRRAVVEVYEAGRPVVSKPLAIGQDNLETKIAVEFVPQTRGWATFEARARLIDTDTAGSESTGTETAPQPRENVLENNAHGFTVDRRPREYRILYFSGRPNWQNKYLRRALEDDPELKLASLIRISGPDRKFDFRARNASDANQLFAGFDESEVVAPRFDEAVFIRIGLGESDLADGYPLQEKELYPFDLVIWGDIEAGYFSPRQFEVTRDYVAKRGGSLLLMGGPHSFGAGNYAGTMIEAMLPVVLDASASVETNEKATYRAEPTVEGFLSGTWALDPDPDRNEWVWNGMPELFGLNRFPMVRAGATAYARATADDTDAGDAPLCLVQRYGAGRCAVLATGETWQWQMQMKTDDATHGRFWRQLIRSLVQDVPAPVVLRSSVDALTAGDEAELEFLVRDNLFEKRTGLQTTVQLAAGDAPPVDLPVEESIAESGVYSVRFTPEAYGPHRITLRAMDEAVDSEVEAGGATAGDTGGGSAGEPIDGPVGEMEQAVEVRPDLREFRDAAYAPELLKTTAGQTKGQFFELDRLREVAAAIPRTAADDTRFEVVHLWRFPGFFALAAILFGLEWYLRRRYGQP